MPLPTGIPKHEFSEKLRSSFYGAKSSILPCMDPPTVIFNPKFFIPDFCYYRRYFDREFQKKLQYNFPKMRGGGSKAVWNFYKNSTVLEGWPFPQAPNIIGPWMGPISLHRIPSYLLKPRSCSNTYKSRQTHTHTFTQNWPLHMHKI